MKKVLLGLICLSLIVQSQGHSAIRFSDGKKSIASAGTAEALTSTSTYATSLSVCADTANTGKITVGATPVATAGSQEGVVLNPGECFSFDSIDSTIDISTVFVNTTVSGEDVAYFYSLEA